MVKKGTLPYLANILKKSSTKSDVTQDHLWYAIRGALDSKLLISNLAEALRIPATKTEQLLIESGFGDFVAHKRLSVADDSASTGSQMGYIISSISQASTPFPDIFSIEFFPSLHKPITLSSSQHEAVSLMRRTILQSVKDDAFVALYRKQVLDYHNRFMESEAKAIDHYVATEFAQGYPRYLVNSGIGANEQFNHFLAHINNASPNRQTIWLIIDSPRHLIKLPPDATIENTLFMEFSRSGKTEETVKIHEYTSRKAKRIVFANSGPLRDIGIRDKNLILELPDQVAGRFGRNKTPILLAPMHVARMDTIAFWEKMEGAIREFDLSRPNCLPLQIAQFTYLYQQKMGINHIYLGCNDEVLAFSGNELIQFWNEGVNKDGNDITMSSYFGLLRDSHANIEGLLSNNMTKMGLFLLRDKMSPPQLPPMTFNDIDPINNDHIGLCFGDEERILAEANCQRFSEVMPTIKITVHGDLTADHAAVLGQLWADTTFCYSRMMNVDPGSNPEVKHVRNRAAKLLAEYAGKKKLRRI